MINTQLLTAYMQRRGIRGISELSRRCGLNRITLYKITRDQKLPGYRAMAQIMAGLGLTAEETGRLFFEQAPDGETTCPS